MKKKLNVKNCKICNKKFTSPYSRKIYCSNECYKVSVRESKKLHMRRARQNEEYREKEKGWYRRNKEKVNRESMEYEKKHLELRKRKKMFRINKKYNIDHKVPSTKEIKERFKKFKECCYCGSKEKITMEHLVPIYRGGDHSINNLFGACPRCNYSKRHSDFKEWYRKQDFYNKKRENRIMKLFQKEETHHADKFYGGKGQT